jgi:hypothetical protein
MLHNAFGVLKKAYGKELHPPPQKLRLLLCMPAALLLLPPLH